MIKEIIKNGKLIKNSFGKQIYLKPDRLYNLVNIYKICLNDTVLYFLICMKYIFILDRIDNLIGKYPCRYFKTGIEYPGCIYCIYDRTSNKLRIDFIKKGCNCDFGSFKKTGTVDSIFNKLYGFLHYLKFKGVIELKDCATVNGKNLYKLKGYSIYEKYGFRGDIGNMSLLFT